MKKFYLKLCALAVCIVLIISAIFSAVFFGIRDVYKDNYQKGYVYQYRALQNADPNQKKIIVIGGSYMTFSVNSDQLSELCHTPVYPLGIHSGMGMSYVIETAKKFANPGDTIVFPFFPFSAHQYGMDLIYLTLDSESDMFWEFFKEHPTEIIKDMGSAVYTKLYEMTNMHEFLKGIRNSIHAEDAVVSPYMASSFDPATGNLTLKRESCEFSDIEKYEGKSLDADMVSEDCINETKDLASYCDSNAIEFYMLYAAFPSVYYNHPTDAELSEYERSLEQRLGLDFIVDIKDCVVPNEYIYNDILHLNDQGTDYYTKLLYEGLSPHL